MKGKVGNGARWSNPAVASSDARKNKTSPWRRGPLVKTAANHERHRQWELERAEEAERSASGSEDGASGETTTEEARLVEKVVGEDVSGRLGDLHPEEG